MTSNLGQLPSLLRRLVLANYLDETTAEAQLAMMKSQTISLTHLLIQQRLVPAKVIAKMVALEIGLPAFDLDSFDKSKLPETYLKMPWVKKLRLLPCYLRENVLYIALSDPIQLPLLQECQFATHKRCLGIVVQGDRLNELIDEVLKTQTVQQLTCLVLTPSTSISVTRKPLDISANTNQANSDEPVVKFINHLLQDAASQAVSDLHFENYIDAYRIRFRRDGLLHETTTPPPEVAERLNARIKVMANLDIAEKRLPQDGQFSLIIDQRHTISCRVSTCPTIAGEKIVIRLLDPNERLKSMTALGYESYQQALLLQCLQYPQGMILVTGPTGSGKTVSLYSALQWLNTETRNIITLEDPVEISLTGINQVTINDKIDFGFAKALPSLLRQDPDVIMIGEMRDKTTADIALKAAQTGHLVLSTLHTNSAAQTLTRLLQMDIERYHLASAITLIIAQRLVRSLCSYCRIPDTAATEFNISNAYLAFQKGCQHCQHGYQGRIALYEMLLMTASMRDAVLRGAHAAELETLAIAEGMQTLKQSGFNKVAQGLTSVTEVLRVCT